MAEGANPALEVGKPISEGIKLEAEEIKLIALEEKPTTQVQEEE